MPQIKDDSLVNEGLVTLRKIFDNDLDLIYGLDDMYLCCAIGGY